jgi:glutaredoxin
MKKHNLIFATACAVVFLTGASFAEIYKWVDENGVIHLSDSPPREIVSTGKAEIIPTEAPDPPMIQNAEKPIPKAGNKTVIATPTSRMTTKPKTPKVELYSTAWCVYCRKAREFFRSRGIAFVEYDVEKDEDAARRKNQLTDRRGVPFVVINGTGIYGYDQGAYIRALKGYL